jgi:hypothetical protein
VIAVEESPDQGIWLPDGRVQGALNFIFDEETVERMRLGYMCVKCQEPFEHPWPERCHVCGCPVRDKQAEYFAQEYAGVVDLSPKTPAYDGGIHERAAKEQSNA